MSLSFEWPLVLLIRFLPVVYRPGYKRRSCNGDEVVLQLTYMKRDLDPSRNTEKLKKLTIPYRLRFDTCRFRSVIFPYHVGGPRSRESEREKRGRETEKERKRILLVGTFTRFIGSDEPGRVQLSCLQGWDISTDTKCRLSRGGTDDTLTR